MERRPPIRSIIADDRRRMVPSAMAALALALGAGAALYYADAGLSLSHYDAKGHLVVARRIVDSLTPGWVQIGAVWLPLPHLLNVLPTQIDFFYRTGAFAIGLSVLAFTTAVFLIARIVLETTRSGLAAALAALVVLVNPDVLYLQSTPMTEPLLMALLAASVWFTTRAVQSDCAADVRRAGLSIAAACLTRYEAWPVTGALLLLAWAAPLVAHRPLRSVALRVARLAMYPAAAVLGFAVLSRATVGEWFVQSGFFVPDNVAMHRPLRALVSVWWGVHELTSYPLSVLGVTGLVALAAHVLRHRDRAAWMLPLSLACAGALPWYAFYAGHPFRIRYMVVLVPVVGLGVGYVVGLAGRARLAAAAVAIAALAAGPRPFSASPMVLEAQWDREHRLGRMQVTAYLQRHWNGQPVMGSMGSLAHYMQELAAQGFSIRDFLHEGNGDLWLEALAYPDLHVEWMLVEEQAEGGDMLADRARRDPRFLAAYDRVAEGGGIALFRRRPGREPEPPAESARGQKR